MASDLFLRQGINVLTGLKKCSQLTDIPLTIISENVWEDLYSVDATDQHYVYWAYCMSYTTDTISTAEFRILARDADLTSALIDADKIYPFTDSKEIISGAPEYLHDNIQIPKNHKYKFQVRCSRVPLSTDPMIVTLDWFSLTKFALYNHTSQLG